MKVNVVSNTFGGTGVVEFDIIKTVVEEMVSEQRAYAGEQWDEESAPSLAVTSTGDVRIYWTPDQYETIGHVVEE